jgi:hypothetical protein
LGDGDVDDDASSADGMVDNWKEAKDGGKEDNGFNWSECMDKDGQWTLNGAKAKSKIV